MVIIFAALVVLAIHVVSAFTFDRATEYVEVEYRSDKIDDTLDGYVVAYVTDTHDIEQDELAGVVAEIERRGADVLLLGGDHRSKKYGYDSIPVLGAANVPDGVYGVEGNHDRRKTLFAAHAENGIVTLQNSGVRVADGLYVAGTEDYWNGKPDFETAAAGAASGDFVLMLTHNADATMHHDTSMADLILSGHTHGGQITVFGAFAPALWKFVGVTEFGQKFMGGMTKDASGTDVFVSKGTGNYTMVPRVFARPQVIYITLKSA